MSTDYPENYETLVEETYAIRYYPYYFISREDRTWKEARKESS